MTILLLTALFAAVSILSAVVVTNLVRQAERLTQALQEVMHGTGPDGQPLPRCEACLYPAHARPEGLGHVPTCRAK